MAYVPSAGSVAAKALDYLKTKEAGASARSKEIGEAIGVAPHLISGSMQDAVKAGLVICCGVTGERGGKQNEYRLGAGVPDTFEPLKPGVVSPHWRGARESQYLYPSTKHAAPAPQPEPDTAPSECLPPELRCGGLVYPATAHEIPVVCQAEQTVAKAAAAPDEPKVDFPAPSRDWGSLVEVYETGKAPEEDNEDAPTFWVSDSGTFRIEAGSDAVFISTEDAARFVAFYNRQLEGS